MAAADLAAEEAMARVAPLIVVHADGGYASGAEHLDRRPLVVAVARALAEHPGLSVTTELVHADPVEALLHCSRDASLLVVGCRGRRAGAGGHAGSVASSVARVADVPVVVHRPLDPSTNASLPRPVLVGVAPDGEPEDPVDFAFAEAALRGTPLYAMHVWSVGVRVEAERRLSEVVTRWSKKYPEVRVHCAVRRSLDVPIALAAASRSAQLLVVGARRHPHGTGASMAAVSQALVHRAGCSVAVVPVE
jgi:nucleotide-binding universal stress UspA family protein